MKSHSLHAIDIYEGIFDDAAMRWPRLVSRFRLDFSRLLRDVEHRGLSFLTITLPAAGKALDRALDDGSLSSAVFPQGLRLNGNRPVLFGDLFDLVFDDLGTLRVDVDVTAVYFLRQFFYCCKKLRLDCHPSKIKETLDEFFDIEESLPDPNPHTWFSDEPVWQERIGHPIRDADAALFERPPVCGVDHNSLWDRFRRYCARIVRQELGDLPWWDLNPKHGPGAVSEAYSVVKYDFPSWPKKLENVFPYDWYGSGDLFSEVRPSDEESPSNLICVPKSQKGPRLICSEPVAHQYMQQAIWRWLEERVDRSALLNRSITFRSQENSRKRALESSHDGLLATIDLSSASDRLSARLVEYVFQGTNILEGMHACRTTELSQTISKDHFSSIRMRKFAPMGSAITFPVQSLVFFIITLFALRLTEGNSDHFRMLKEDCRRITVFGDDIIAPSSALETIKFLLQECGLKVNADKTFGGLNFRESCGCDAFQGVDVTPAYALEPYDGSPSSMATTIEVSNNFHKHGFWRTAARIVNQFPEQERKRFFIQRVGEERSLGLCTFSEPCNDHLDMKWDLQTQRMYYKALNVTAIVKKSKGKGEASLTQYFVEKPDPLLPWESGQAGRPKLRKSLGRVYPV